MNVSLHISLVLAVAFPLHAQDPGHSLQEVQVMQREDLGSVTSVVSSPDGRFLYAAAFNPGNVLTFKRDVSSGQIEYQDIVTGEALNAAVNLGLSSDGNYLVASSFRANSVTLMKRDPELGSLTVMDGAFDGQAGAAGLKFVIMASFSKDGKFIYTASADGVGVFERDNNRMKFLQFEQVGGLLKGVRDTVLSPDGRWLYAPAYQSGTLGVFERDLATGKLQAVQVVANDGKATRGIAGAFRVKASDDGKHVYLSSGRFNGDQAISAFEVQGDGKLKQIQVLDNQVEGFEEFAGGNSLAMSHDGGTLFALASVADKLFRLKRDANTGKLSIIGSQQVGELAKPGSAGLCLSPDGKFLYVADETTNSIVAYRNE